METLTINRLKEMEPEKIFSSGKGIYIELYSHKIKWVAVRGGIHDWAIYYGYPEMSDIEIARFGDKVFSEDLIKKLVFCDEGAFAMYRY